MFDATAFFVPVGILTVIFWGLTTIIKTFKEASIRKRMIELGHLEPEKQWILQKTTSASSVYANLRYGILLVCLGYGFLAIRKYNFESDSPAIFGIMFALAGVGFLLYFVIMKYLYKKVD